MSSKEWKKPPANIMSLFSLHHQQQLQEQEQEQPPICVKDGGGGSVTKAASPPALRAGVEDLPRDSGVSHHRRRGEEVTLEKIQVIKRSLAQLQQQIMELESDIIVEKGKTKTQHKGGKPIKPPKPPQKKEKKEKKGFASQKKRVSPAMYSFLLSQGFRQEEGKGVITDCLSSSTSEAERGLVTDCLNVPPLRGGVRGLVTDCLNVPPLRGGVRGLEGEANNQVSHFSRTFLLQSIHAYIKTHSLQHPQKKTTFMVDSVLQELFPPSTTSEGGEGESQTIRYFDLPRLLSAHIIG